MCVGGAVRGMDTHTVFRRVDVWKGREGDSECVPTMEGRVGVSSVRVCVCGGVESVFVMRI